MKEVAFDNEKYLKLVSKQIKERVNRFGAKLYLEFGGKLVGDHHASRVLPGFNPDIKLKIVKTLKKKIEILFVLSADDIIVSKLRSDTNITYVEDVLKSIEIYQKEDIFVRGVVITRYDYQKSVDLFMTKLKNLNINVYKHYKIKSYPNDIELTLSEEGFGQNDYVKTQMPIVIVTAPGPGSGKFTTCLSQMYHDNKNNIKAGYAKFETFPVWNLPVKHPLNLVYESATADLGDLNVLDKYHLERYGLEATNYNRDMQIFPIAKHILEKMHEEAPYYSPTDMSINMVGFAIINEKQVIEASNQEAIRRHLHALVSYQEGKVLSSVCDKTRLILDQLGLSIEDRKSIAASLDNEKETKLPSVAIELPCKTMIIGTTTEDLTASAAAFVNALKYVAKIDKRFAILSPSIVRPIIDTKKRLLKYENYRMQVSDILYALSLSVSQNPLAYIGLENLDKLKGSQVHSSIMLNNDELDTFKKIHMDVTVEAKRFVI